MSSSMSPDFSASSLYCREDVGDIASWDSDAGVSPSPKIPYLTALPDDNRSIDDLLDSELHHMPESDYLGRFRDRSLDVTTRQDAINWILKVQAHYNFQPVTVYLSVNYLDRFLSSHTLPRGNGWPFQLLSVACLSLAAKVEETEVPLLLDLQVCEPTFVFEPKTIQRMELLVMTNLKWRMRSVTPFDFVDYFVGKLRNLDLRRAFPNRIFARASDLILSTNRVIDFLGIRPSVVAAAAVLCAAGESSHFAIGEDRNTADFFASVNKEMVTRCHQLMEEYLIDTCPSALIKPRSDPTPQSPIGVLDAAACGSCDTQKSSFVMVIPEESRAEPSNKRRKLSATPCTGSIDTGGNN